MPTHKFICILHNGINQPDYVEIESASPANAEKRVRQERQFTGDMYVWTRRRFIETQAVILAKRIKQSWGKRAPQDMEGIAEAIDKLTDSRMSDSLVAAIVKQMIANAKSPKQAAAAAIAPEPIAEPVAQPAPAEPQPAPEPITHTVPVPAEPVGATRSELAASKLEVVANADQLGAWFDEFKGVTLRRKKDGLAVVRWRQYKPDPDVVEFDLSAPKKQAWPFYRLIHKYFEPIETI